MTKSVAIAVTDYNGPFYDDSSLKTGAFFSEVYHPWHVFTKAGYKVQLVSESGKFGWDDKSISSIGAAPEELAILKEADHPFNKFTSEIKSVKEVSASDYDSVYAAGGHGTVYDFDGNTPGLYKLFADVYTQNKPVAAVCHGPVLLAFVKVDGKPIIEGKKVTGFPDSGETLMSLDETLKRTEKKRVKEIVDAANCTWVEPTEPFGPFTVSDARILTGANPASATPLAEELVATLN